MESTEYSQEDSETPGVALVQDDEDSSMRDNDSFEASDEVQYTPPRGVLTDGSNQGSSPSPNDRSKQYWAERQLEERWSISSQESSLQVKRKWLESTFAPTGGGNMPSPVATDSRYRHFDASAGSEALPCNKPKIMVETVNDDSMATEYVDLSADSMSASEWLDNLAQETRRQNQPATPSPTAVTPVSTPSPSLLQTRVRSTQTRRITTSRLATFRKNRQAPILTLFGSNRPSTNPDPLATERLEAFQDYVAAQKEYAQQKTPEAKAAREHALDRLRAAKRMGTV